MVNIFIKTISIFALLQVLIDVAKFDIIGAIFGWILVVAASVGIVVIIDETIKILTTKQ